MAVMVAGTLTIGLTGVGQMDALAASAKVKLSRTSVTVSAGKTKTVKIKNVNKKNVTKLTVKSSDTEAVTAKASGKLAVKVTGRKAYADAGVNVILKLKKKVAGKKKYQLKLAVHVDPSAEDKALINDFIDNFKMLAAVPRKSKHEKAISDKLKAWAEGLGFTVKQNEANDLIFDVPATAGYENIPLVALQVHMDMVCLARDGVGFDPLNDPIKMIIDKKKGTITADGTTLGADDGAGVSMVMMIVKNEMDHGPLRIIITTNEEDGMTGVLAITKEDLNGVKYLINVDSEVSDTLTISSAAGGRITAKKTPETAPAVKKLPMKLTISGLLGGHSGLVIDKNRCNACLTMGALLKGLGESVTFELASLEGGTTENAIPAKAEAVIVVDPEDKTKVDTYIEKKYKEYKEQYKDSDAGLTLECSKGDPVQTVLTEQEKQKLFVVLSGLINGVNSMSPVDKDLVESSANLGVLKANPSKIYFYDSVRSSDTAKFDVIINKNVALAEANGFTTSVEKNTKAWPAKEDSVLVPVISESYKSVTGKDMLVKGVHGGLECGNFAALVEGLDIASIGPDVKNAHTPDEILYLNSIPLEWKLLKKVLVSLPA